MILAHFDLHFVLHSGWKSKVSNRHFVQIIHVHVHPFFFVVNIEIMHMHIRTYIYIDIDNDEWTNELTCDICDQSYYALKHSLLFFSLTNGPAHILVVIVNRHCVHFLGDDDRSRVCHTIWIGYRISNRKLRIEREREEREKKKNISFFFWTLLPFILIMTIICYYQFCFYFRSDEKQTTRFVRFMEED